MSPFWKNTLWGLGISSLSFFATAALADEDVDQITALLGKYETALNASDTAAVMKVYGPDAVFMPQNAMPQVGTEAIRAAYDGVFAAIDLNIDFIIDEIQFVSDDWAFARTRSEGTTVINANGAKIEEGNQELFLLQRQADGAWKVARYIFSTTKPMQ